MDAVEFFKTVNRLCENQSCRECPVCKEGVCMVMNMVRIDGGLVESIEETVSKVEQWAKGHPVKTRQSEFLKMFPNARIDDSRVLIFCPKDFLPVGARSTYCEKHENCKECRKDYWLTEITDND
nr:MAG TPA: NADH-ubiquinone oxidoreductase [Caudoviricetes sp.]